MARKIDLYQLLWESLRGKLIQLQVEEDDVESFYQGRVRGVMRNDNSHVDILFERDDVHVYPDMDKPVDEQAFLQDVYNLHMNTEIKIIE